MALYKAARLDGDDFTTMHDLLGLVGVDEGLEPWVYSPEDDEYCIVQDGWWVIVHEGLAPVQVSPGIFDFIHAMCEGTIVENTRSQKDGSFAETVTGSILRDTVLVFNTMPYSAYDQIEAWGKDRYDLDENLVRAARIRFGNDAKIGVPSEYTRHKAAPYDGTSGLQAKITVYKLNY